MRKKTKTTSIDIAHRAGVSQATVSRVLCGSPLVNAETRKRVEAVALELNYKVDRHASSLRTQRSGTLALLLFEDPTPDDSHINPFFLSMLGSITRACARQGQDLLVSFQNLSDDGRAINNRAENSHQPFRRRERAMHRFRRMSTLQKFTSVHASFHNHFNHERHLIDRHTYKTRRSTAMAEWRNLAS